MLAEIRNEGIQNYIKSLDAAQLTIPYGKSQD